MDSAEKKYAGFLAAKYEVAKLCRQGRLLSPEEAMYLAGHSKGLETLWSVAFRFAPEYELDAEELNAYLEAQFPNLVKIRERQAKTMTWDDVAR